MGRNAVEHPIGRPSAGFVNCSSNIHSAAGCEAPYRDETQVLANPPILCMDSGKTGKIVESMRHSFRLCFPLKFIPPAFGLAGVIKMEERHSIGLFMVPPFLCPQRLSEG